MPKYLIGHPDGTTSSMTAKSYAITDDGDLAFSNFSYGKDDAGESKLVEIITYVRKPWIAVATQIREN